jgi:hypothetical protein
MFKFWRTERVGGCCRKRKIPKTKKRAAKKFLGWPSFGNAILEFWILQEMAAGCCLQQKAVAARGA